MNDLKRSLTVLFCLVNLYGFVSADEPLPKVVIKINDTSITSDDYLKRLVEQDDGRTIENIIVEKIIELELIANKLPLVTEPQIDTHIALMEKQLQVTQGPYASVNTFLQNSNMKMSDLRRKTKREIGLRRILGNSIEVKNDEVIKYYDEFKSLYTSPEARRVIAITVFHRFSPAPKMLQTDRSEAEAKTIAETIRKDWVANKDAVKTLWDTKQHFIRGYDQPYGIPTTMKEDKNFADVFKASLGTVTEVIADKNGYNIYKVIEDLPAKVIPFEEVKDQIKVELISNKIEKCITDGDFEKIKKKYKVEKYLEVKDKK